MLAESASIASSICVRVASSVSASPFSPRSFFIPYFLLPFPLHCFSLHPIRLLNWLLDQTIGQTIHTNLHIVVKVDFENYKFNVFGTLHRRHDTVSLCPVRGSKELTRFMNELVLILEEQCGSLNIE